MSETKKEWRRKNRERLRQYQRDWKAKNPTYRRDKHLAQKYSLTQAEYDQMLRDQDGGCAICHTTDPGPRKRFFVDHDHRTGQVRGLLCQRHNTMLGHAQDDPAILRAGAAYLERFVTGSVDEELRLLPCPPAEP